MKKRMNSSFSFKSSWCNSIIKIILGKQPVRKKLNKFCPPKQHRRPLPLLLSLSFFCALPPESGRSSRAVEGSPACYSPDFGTEQDSLVPDMNNVRHFKNPEWNPEKYQNPGHYYCCTMHYSTVGWVNFSGFEITVQCVVVAKSKKN